MINHILVVGNLRSILIVVFYILCAPHIHEATLDVAFCYTFLTTAKKIGCPHCQDCQKMTGLLEVKRMFGKIRDDFTKFQALKRLPTVSSNFPAKAVKFRRVLILVTLVFSCSQLRNLISGTDWIKTAFIRARPLFNGGDVAPQLWTPCHMSCMAILEKMF